jgi:chorismate mutase
MNPEQELQRLRAEIDSLDHELLHLAARRLEAARQVRALKQEMGLPERDPKREAEMLSRAQADPPQGMQGQQAASFQQALLQWCRTAG